MAFIRFFIPNIAVKVVPIFEPRKSGYTVSTLTKSIPTMGVKVEVKIELDWTKMVHPAPTNKRKYPKAILAQALSNVGLTTFFIVVARVPRKIKEGICQFYNIL